MVWALWFSADCGSAKIAGPQSSKVEKAQLPVSSVTLTPEHSIASFPVAASVFTGVSDVLEVEITKVVNPAATPVTILVSLADSKADKVEKEPNSIGNFSLYPADQPGKFLLRATPALRRASTANGTGKSPDMRLVFEMKRIDESRAWTPLEVTISQPKWRAAEK